MYESDQELDERRGKLELQLAAYKELVTLGGYKSLLEVLKARLLNLRSEKMSMDVDSTEKAFAAAKLGGRIFELESIMTLPEFVIDNLQADLQQVYRDQASRTENSEEER